MITGDVTVIKQLHINLDDYLLQRMCSRFYVLKISSKNKIKIKIYMYRREIWETLARPPRTWEAYGVQGIHPWPAHHESGKLMASQAFIPRLDSPPLIWVADGVLGIHLSPVRHVSGWLMASQASIPRQSAMNLGGSCMNFLSYFKVKVSV